MPTLTVEWKEFQSAGSLLSMCMFIRRRSDGGGGACTCVCVWSIPPRLGCFKGHWCHQVGPVNEGDDEGEELRVESRRHRLKTLQSGDLGTWTAHERGEAKIRDKEKKMKNNNNNRSIAVQGERGSEALLYFYQAKYHIVCLLLQQPCRILTSAEATGAFQTIKITHHSWFGSRIILALFLFGFLFVFISATTCQ